MAEKYYPDEMYNLPYEQARAKYGAGVGNNVYFMSKDQFELEKARIEKRKKMAANEGKPDWWTQPGEAEKTIEKITGKADPTKEEVSEKANEIIERRITPDQQGIQSKGNPGDDKINNPDALDSSEVDKLHNELKSMAQTEENMEPGTMTFTPEQVEEAKNNASITKEVPGSTSANNALEDVATPKKDDPPDVVEDKNKYNKSMMSIWDAYRNGLIDKETAGYFTIDAIATLAKNLGRSIGNVGAQFSGGTIDNGHDESKWGQRQNAMLSEVLVVQLEEKQKVSHWIIKQRESEMLILLNSLKIRLKCSRETLKWLTSTLIWHTLKQTLSTLSRKILIIQIVHSKWVLLHILHKQVQQAQQIMRLKHYQMQ